MSWDAQQCAFADERARASAVRRTRAPPARARCSRADRLCARARLSPRAPYPLTAPSDARTFRPQLQLLWACEKVQLPLAMPSRARVALTFPPRTDRSRSLPLSRTAVFPPGFEPPASCSASAGSSSSSSSSRGSPRSVRHASAVANSSDTGGTMIDSSTTTTTTTTTTQTTHGRTRSAGGVLDMQTILATCLASPSVIVLANDRYSPPVPTAVVVKPKPVLFPSDPPKQSRRRAGELAPGVVATRSAAAAAAAAAAGKHRAHPYKRSGSNATALSSIKSTKGGQTSKANKAAATAAAAAAAAAAAVATTTAAPPMSTGRRGNLFVPQPKAKRKSGLGSTARNLSLQPPLATSTLVGQPFSSSVNSQPASADPVSFNGGPQQQSTKRRQTSGSPLSQLAASAEPTSSSSSSLLGKFTDAAPLMKGSQTKFDVHAARPAKLQQVIISAAQTTTVSPSAGTSHITLHALASPSTLPSVVAQSLSAAVVRS